jgi:hypothetical protein
MKSKVNKKKKRSRFMFPSSPSKIPPIPTLISVKNSSDIPKKANKPEATPKQQRPPFF